MAKYHVLTRSAALALGIINVDGTSREHAATLKRIAQVAVASSDIYAMALAEARQAAQASGNDQYVLDECGDSELVAAAVEILSVTGTNADGTSWTLSVGDRVEHPADDCDPDSGDTGRISAFADRETAVVYWDSGVETPCAVERLVSI